MIETTSQLLAIQGFMRRFGVSDDALTLFCSKLTERQIPKKEFFVLQGETCRHMWKAKNTSGNFTSRIVFAASTKVFLRKSPRK